jgi:ribosomal-protein-alanine N-acetyltransferase
MGIDARTPAVDGVTRSLRIDAATREDVPAIVEIERAAFSDPWSAQSFGEALDHSAVYFAVARRDGVDVLGYVVAWFVADEGEIANIAVSPAGWGTGIGQALLDAALDEAERRRIGAVFLEVRDSNERARKLYQSRGFEEVGRRRGYYRRPVEDAIVLRRALLRGA